MTRQITSKLDRALASVCWNYPVCRTARQRREGAAWWLVRRLKRGLCPFCRAYERVYGRAAHESAVSQPLPGPSCFDRDV
jgi:hypothetical protein